MMTSNSNWLHLNCDMTIPKFDMMGSNWSNNWQKKVTEIVCACMVSCSMKAERSEEEPNCREEKETRNSEKEEEVEEENETLDSMSSTN